MLNVATTATPPPPTPHDSSSSRLVERAELVEAPATSTPERAIEELSAITENREGGGTVTNGGRPASSPSRTVQHASCCYQVYLCAPGSFVFADVASVAFASPRTATAALLPMLFSESKSTALASPALMIDGSFQQRASAASLRFARGTRELCVDHGPAEVRRQSQFPGARYFIGKRSRGTHEYRKGGL